MEECKDIMVIDWATRIPTDAEEEYLSHLFCLGGGCWYRFNGMDFELHAGDLSIIRKWKMIENIEVSMDFCAKIIYVKSGFVELCNLRAIMEWKDNWPFPQLCHAPLAWTADCLSSRSWTAWVVYQGYWTSFLPWNAYQRHADGYPWFFDFHARIYDESDISTQMPPSYIVSWECWRMVHTANTGRYLIMSIVCALRRNTCRKC